MLISRYPLWYNIEPIRIPEDFELSFSVLVFCGNTFVVIHPFCALIL